MKCEGVERYVTVRSSVPLSRAAGSKRRILCGHQTSVNWFTFILRLHTFFNKSMALALSFSCGTRDTMPRLYNFSFLGCNQEYGQIKTLTPWFLHSATYQNFGSDPEKAVWGNAFFGGTPINLITVCATYQTFRQTYDQVIGVGAFLSNFMIRKRTQKSVRKKVCTLAHISTWLFGLCLRLQKPWAADRSDVYQEEEPCPRSFRHIPSLQSQWYY